MDEEHLDERIDFSAIDPSQNQLRWARTVDAVVARALSERRKRLSIERQLLRWARPVLVMAAGLCILTWTADLINPNRSSKTTAQQPAWLTLAGWAANNQIPEPSDLVGTLRGN